MRLVYALRLIVLLASLIGVVHCVIELFMADSVTDAVMWFGVMGGLGAIADREIEATKC